MDLKRMQRIQEVLQTNKGKICRYCLDNSGLFDLNNEENRGVEIRNTILECIGIGVQSNDGLPAYLCWECEKSFFSYQRFRKKCLENYCLLQLVRPENDLQQETLPTNKSSKSASKSESTVAPVSEQTIEINELQAMVNLANDDYIIHELVTHDYADATEKQPFMEEPPELVDERIENVHVFEVSLLPEIGAESPAKRPKREKLVAVKEVAVKQKRKSKEPARKCESCELLFDSAPALKKHVLQIHNVKKEPRDVAPILMENGLFRCNTCDSGFAEVAMLQMHEKKVHNLKVPHVCEICDKTFSDLCNYQRHKRIHTGEKPFKCPECSKEFSDNGNYNRHLRFHAGDLKYKCEFCGHGFISKWDLEKHLRVHSGERPYKCSEKNCSKAFKSAVELRTHFRTHTGERPHVCNVCNKTFTAYGNMWRHKKKVHPDDSSLKGKRPAISMKSESMND